MAAHHRLVWLNADKRRTAIPAKRTISTARFTALTSSLVGQRIGHSWRGYGSAIFLELGALRRLKGRRHLRGEFTIMIEWSWRIEKPRSIMAGSWSSDRMITTSVGALKGRRLTSVTAEGRLPELNLRLSGGLWLHSFATAEGQPVWAIGLRDGSWLSVEGGRIVRDADDNGAQPWL